MPSASTFHASIGSSIWRICARCAGELQVCLDATIGVQQACPRFEHGAHVAVGAKRGKPACDFSRAQIVDRQVVLRRTRASARDERSVRGADHQAAGLHEQPLPAHALQLVPARVRTLNQRHVLRMLEIRFPDDARLPGARTELMRRRKAVEADDLVPAPRKVKCGGASGGAEARDCDPQLNSQAPTMLPRTHVRSSAA